AGAAYYVYGQAPALISSPRAILATSIVAGLLAFILSRYLIFNILLRPVLGKHRGASGGAGALLSLIPAAFLIWVLATGFRLTGTVMEMEQFGNNVTVAEGEQIHQGWLAHWRRAMDSDSLALLLAKVDPFIKQSKAVLVGFLISTRDQAAPGQLADADADAAAIINSPAMRDLSNDPGIRKLIEDGEYVALLQHPKVRQATQESTLADHLNAIDLSGNLESALFSGGSDQQPKVRRRIPNRLWRPREEPAAE
ncbi:MAG: hypothetical protein ACR2RV_15825, partial [Verrucomicrobiales bacterium]